MRGRRERRQGREKEEREATGVVARKRSGEKGGNRVVSEYRSTRAIFTDKGRRCNLLGLRYTSIHRAFIYPLASRYMPLPCVYSFTSLLSPFSPCPRILRHSLSPSRAPQRVRFSFSPVPSVLPNPGLVASPLLCAAYKPFEYVTSIYKGVCVRRDDRYARRCMRALMHV